MSRCRPLQSCSIRFHKLFFVLRKPEGQTVNLVQTRVDVSGWEDADFAAVVW